MTLPSEISPALTRDRLQLLAAEIVRVRREALEVFQPEKGDNAWSFGCLCYVRTCEALEQLERSGRYPWLRVQVHGLAFTMIVDGEPLKFYSGDPKRPSDRMCRGLSLAIEQRRLPFMDDEEFAKAEGSFWLMAIERHEDFSVSRVTVVRTNAAGDVSEAHLVPIDESVAVATAVTERREEPIDQPPPPVGPKRVKTQLVGGDEDGGS